jgi:hypothetical protein
MILNFTNICTSFTSPVTSRSANVTVGGKSYCTTTTREGDVTTSGVGSITTKESSAV